MRKLIVTCECGQKMQVPRSYMGKTGLCTKCGRSIRITNNNTGPMPGVGPGSLRDRLFGSLSASASGVPNEHAKRRFAEAVDLFSQQRFAQALAIFDALAQEFPGNPDILDGRARCMRAMNRTALPFQGDGALGQTPELTPEAVKQVVLEKLLHGRSEEIQLQAAELACKILGLLSPNGMASAPQLEPAVSHETSESSRPIDAGADASSDSAGPRGVRDDSAGGTTAGVESVVASAGDEEENANNTNGRSHGADGAVPAEEQVEQEKSSKSAGHNADNTRDKRIASMESSRAASGH